MARAGQEGPCSPRPSLGFLKGEGAWLEAGSLGGGEGAMARGWLSGGEGAWLRCVLT